MAKKAATEPRDMARRLLRRYDRTFAEEAGIDPKTNRPTSLFQLLCLSLLFSAGIRSDIALNAMQALLSNRLVVTRTVAGVDVGGPCQNT